MDEQHEQEERARESAPREDETEQTSMYQDWREYRRQLAWDMVQKGMTQKSVAELLDVTQAAVSQWVARAREQGRQALESRPYPERARKLAEEHIDRLRTMLAEGAEVHGFDRWTTANIAEVIAETFEVDYHPAHVSRLLKQWGFVWLGMAGWVMP